MTVSGSKLWLVAAFACAAAWAVPTDVRADEGGKTTFMLRGERRVTIDDVAARPSEPAWARDPEVILYEEVELFHFHNDTLAGLAQIGIRLEDVFLTDNLFCGEPDTPIWNVTAEGVFKLTLAAGTIEGTFRVNLRRDQPQGKDFLVATQEATALTGRFEGKKFEGMLHGWEAIAQEGLVTVGQEEIFFLWAITLTNP